MYQPQSLSLLQPVHSYGAQQQCSSFVRLGMYPPEYHHQQQQQQQQVHPVQQGQWMVQDYYNNQIPYGQPRQFQQMTPVEVMPKGTKRKLGDDTNATAKKFNRPTVNAMPSAMVNNESFNNSIYADVPQFNTTQYRMNTSPNQMEETTHDNVRRELRNTVQSRLVKNAATGEVDVNSIRPHYVVEPTSSPYMNTPVQYVPSQGMNMNQQMHPMSINTSMNNANVGMNGRIVMPPPYPGLVHSMQRPIGHVTHMGESDDQRKRREQLENMQRELRRVMGIKEKHAGAISSTGASPASSANSPPSCEASPSCCPADDFADIPVNDEDAVTNPDDMLASIDFNIAHEVAKIVKGFPGFGFENNESRLYHTILNVS